jgi:hypothetical protein
MKDNKSVGRKGVIRYAGIGLIVISFILYGGILFLPFIPLSMELKGSAAMGLIIAGEASFWIGALLVGREVASNYRSFFRIGKRGEEKGQ